MSHLAKKEPKTFFASCPIGLEQLLDKELRSSEIKMRNIHKGGVEFITSHIEAVKFIVNTTLSSRVYIRVTAFEFTNIDEFYDNIKNQWWHLTIPTHQTFKISTLFDLKSKYTFNNSMFFSLKAKDAIVDQIQERKGERPSVNKENPDYTFLIRIEEKKHGNNAEQSFFAMIYLDLTKAPLSDRGLRGFSTRFDHVQHEAPLRENLAQGIVRLTEWKPGEEIFADLTCGSGTVLIEAIYFAAKLPGSFFNLKGYVFDRDMPWAFLNHAWWKELKLEGDFLAWARDLIDASEDRLKALPHDMLIGNDLNGKYLEMTKRAIKGLGVFDIIKLQKEDIKTAKLQTENKGVVFFNPPYGKRLNAEDDLGELYYQLGENLKNNFKGNRAYVLTAESNLRKQISLKTSKRIEMKNGNLDCRLLYYKLY